MTDGPGWADTAWVGSLSSAELWAMFWRGYLSCRAGSAGPRPVR
jgi:hypothetical protein